MSAHSSLSIPNPKHNSSLLDIFLYDCWFLTICDFLFLFPSFIEDASSLSRSYWLFFAKYYVQVIVLETSIWLVGCSVLPVANVCILIFFLGFMMWSENHLLRVLICFFVVVITLYSCITVIGFKKKKKEVVLQ